MTLLLAVVILTLIYALVVAREPRTIVNVLLLPVLLTGWYEATLSLALEKGWTGLSRTLIEGTAPSLILAVLIIVIVFGVNGVIVLRRERMNLTHLLPLGVSLTGVLGLVAVLTYYTLSADQLLNNPWITYASWFFILSCGIASLTFIGFLLYSILYQALPRRKDFDFVIFHGAGLLNGDTVTPLLKGRADKAIQVYRRLQDAGKRAKIIPSGGQGADELVSEDQAISTYLQSQGVTPADILLEDGSATTEENLLMSKKVGEALVDNPKLYT